MRSGIAATAATLVVVSDLHLGDGDSVLETWRAPQQEAWERLLRDAMPGGRYSGGPVELIVNGDCFDFLAMAPAPVEGGAVDASSGLARIARIVAAHDAWFAALRAWLRASGGTVTFLIGNHDVELAFGAVRACIRTAIAAPPGAVRFCLARIYQPLPDVVIEHGCQFDPWNAIPGLWDDATPAVPASPGELDALDALDAHGVAGPAAIELPWGSRYYYRVMLPIARRFPYLAALHPPISHMAGLALLCLCAPDLVLAGAHHARALREEDGATDGMADAPLGDLASRDERDPATLFQAVLPEMAALRGQVWRRAGAISGTGTPGIDRGGAEALARALATGELAALRAIFARPAIMAHAMPEEDADAGAALLDAYPDARVALCGHTHVEGNYPVIGPDGTHSRFLNTGTWQPRLAWPEPDALAAATLAWLRDPLAAPSPLRSATAFTYAVLRASPGQPARAELHAV